MIKQYGLGNGKKGLKKNELKSKKTFQICKNYDNMKGSTMNTTTDRRVRRTKKQLTESLAKLLCEKPLKKITKD